MHHPGSCTVHKAARTAPKPCRSRWRESARTRRLKGCRKAHNEEKQRELRPHMRSRSDLTLVSTSRILEPTNSWMMSPAVTVGPMPSSIT